LAVQGHSRLSKVDDFGTNRKRVCDFLVVINSNYGPVLHRLCTSPLICISIVTKFNRPSKF